MSNTKHTAGPWKLYDKPMLKQNQWVESIGARERGDIICLAPSVEHIDSLEMWEANAKLIAAAPEMYDAMKEFCDRVDRGEVRSKKTYAKFKAILSTITD